MLENTLPYDFLVLLGVVSIEGNHICEAGAAAIADALLMNSTLTELE